MTGSGSAADLIVEAASRWRGQTTERLVIAIDGHGAAGKTTLADALAARLRAGVVHTDDHFHPARPTDDPRPMARYYDWEALARDAIRPALAAQPADSPLIVEGVSSGAPALSGLVTHAVYVDTPEPIRLLRLRERIPPEEWDEQWLAAERVYFASRPARSFDLIVPGARPRPRPRPRLSLRRLTTKIPPR